MQDMDRRTLISLLGIAAVTPLRRAVAATPAVSSTAIVAPGGNRYAYASEAAAKWYPCKVTAADSGGAFSAFENLVPPKAGPPLHLHHREDEWFYVATGRFIFEIDGKRTELGQGGSVFAPKGLPHRWANSAAENALLLVALFPGGFETFFDEIMQAQVAKGNNISLDEWKAMFARHQMDLLGPPIFP